MFGTSYDTSADRFQNYYKDLSQRMKNREIDLVIVVNMFLTGFDATTLNTLFVDKNLRAHGLLQAYSRTNRILNSVKTYGNIVAFRNLGTGDQRRASHCSATRTPAASTLLKPYGEYYGEYARRRGLLAELPETAGQPIVGETAQKRFIELFGQILRLENILTSFDDFAGDERPHAARSAGLPERLPRTCTATSGAQRRRQGTASTTTSSSRSSSSNRSRSTSTTS